MTLRILQTYPRLNVARHTCAHKYKLMVMFSDYKDYSMHTLQHKKITNFVPGFN